MARTCVLILSFQPASHRLSCNNETIQNAPKHYEMHQIMSLGSNGVDRVRSLPKISMRLRAQTFALIAQVQRVLHLVSCRYKMIPNTPKYYKGPMGWIGCVRCKKSQRHFVAWTIALIAPVHPILHRVSCIYEMIPNAPKHYETHQNMSLVSNRVDQVRLLEKLQARTIALIAPVLPFLHRVSCIYEMIPNASKH